MMKATVPLLFVLAQDARGQAPAPGDHRVVGLARSVLGRGGGRVLRLQLLGAEPGAQVAAASPIAGWPWARAAAAGVSGQDFQWPGLRVDPGGQSQS